MSELYLNLMFHTMKDDPLLARTLLKKGGPKALMDWAWKRVENMEKSLSKSGLDGLEVDMEICRNLMPMEEELSIGQEERARKKWLKIRLTEEELKQIDDYFESLEMEGIPEGLYEELTAP